MFEGPEYASYIALMRELRLERKPQDGDWFDDGDPVEPLLYLWSYRTEYGPYEWDSAVWLPRLDQWLEMLEKADCRYFRFYDGARVKARYNGTDVQKAPRKPGWYASCVRHDGGLTEVDEGHAPSREEACARLWLAVTGRTVPA